MELLLVYALVMVLAMMVEKLWAEHMGLQVPQIVVFVNLAEVEMSHCS